MVSIDKEAVSGLIKYLLEQGYAVSTVNRHLACLSKALSCSTEWKGGVITMPRFKFFNEEESARTFYLSHELEEAIFAAVRKLDEHKPGAQGGPPRKKDAQEHLALFAVLVETGARLSEGLRIKWSDVDGKDWIRFWRREDLKNRKARTVPQTDACRVALESRRGNPGGPFHGMTKRRAQDVWQAALKLVDKKKHPEVEDSQCVIHCLRHTFATRLLSETGDLKLVQEMLGHTTIATTAKIYAHVPTKRLTYAAQVLNNAREATKENRGTTVSKPQQEQDRLSA